MAPNSAEIASIELDSRLNLLSAASYWQCVLGFFSALIRSSYWAKATWSGGFSIVSPAVSNPGMPSLPLSSSRACVVAPQAPGYAGACAAPPIPTRGDGRWEERSSRSYLWVSGVESIFDYHVDPATRFLSRYPPKRTAGKTAYRRKEKKGSRQKPAFDAVVGTGQRGRAGWRPLHCTAVGPYRLVYSGDSESHRVRMLR